jgi:hypothetical protein
LRFDGRPNFSYSPSHISATDVGAFILPSPADVSRHPRLMSLGSLLPHTKTSDRPRRDAMKRDLDHGDLTCLLKGTNMLLDCGTRADWTTTM